MQRAGPRFPHSRPGALPWLWDPCIPDVTELSHRPQPRSAIDRSGPPRTPYALRQSGVNHMHGTVGTSSQEITDRIQYSAPELRSIRSVDRSFAPRPGIASATSARTVGEIMTPRGPLLGSISFSRFGGFDQHEDYFSPMEIDSPQHGIIRSLDTIPPAPPPPAAFATPRETTVVRVPGDPSPRQHMPTVVAGPCGISIETWSLLRGDHIHGWESPTGPHESLDAGIEPPLCEHRVWNNKEWIMLQDGTTFELLLDSP